MKLSLTPVCCTCTSQSCLLLAGVLVPTCFGLGIALFALLAHVFRDWRMLTLICSLPGFVGVYWYRSVFLTL